MLKARQQPVSTAANSGVSWLVTIALYQLGWCSHSDWCTDRPAHTT